jgi:hypothetical protein
MWNNASDLILSRPLGSTHIEKTIENQRKSFEGDSAVLFSNRQHRENC